MLKVLHIAAGPASARLIEGHLVAFGEEHRYHWVADRRDLGEALVGQAWDAVLVDHVLPALPLAEVLARLSHALPGVPVVLLVHTLPAPAETVADLVRLGVWDIVCRESLPGLAAVLERTLRRREAGFPAREEAESEARQRLLRAAEDSLRLVSERLETALKAAAVVAFSQDRELRYTWICNPALGFSPDEIVGKRDHDLFERPEDAERTEAIKARVLATGIGERQEVTVRDGGVDRHYHLIVDPLRDEAGRIIGVTCAALDITEQKTVEREIQRLNAELEERVHLRTLELEQSNEALLRSNMDLQRFAHAAAHDLQTPLRSIVGFTQLLQREIAGSLDPRAGEWMNLVISNTKRLQTLIEELLAYSRLDAQSRPFTPVDLQEVFNQVVASLAAPIAAAGAEVRGESLPVVTADRTQMAQLLQNLIENGIKYNRSPSPRVQVSGAVEGDWWLLSVADNGMGIDPRHHQRIFEIFRRLHTHSEIPGTGIGLAICYRIVERHGGRIWVESEGGQGSAFRFTLPRISAPPGI